MVSALPGTAWPLLEIFFWQLAAVVLIVAPSFNNTPPSCWNGHLPQEVAMRQRRLLRFHSLKRGVSVLQLVVHPRLLTVNLPPSLSSV